MTTKEQETKALEKIAAILETLDADGWVNTAFAGVVRDARENIENDFACSWMDRAQAADRKAERAEAETAEARQAAEAAIMRADREANNREAIARDAEAWRKTAQDLQAQVNAQGARIAELETDREAQDLVIVRLKARLYDAEHGAL